ncbi:hypothetical protein SCHPADRAFT_866019 [Schizopora paradoxa]|uniref:Integral membrane protein n=1 Tax=Schizopora paradoxa TaxID=27342 RepID=A0A0H2SAQ0_9AGAM|nr:hypothetical protein SCHPADRAFT_866019 [Schizopora paradoxa]
MTMSFAPQESSSDLWTERAELSGTIVASAAYGIHICVLILILRAPKDSISTRLKRLLSCGVIILFATATIQLASQVRLLQVMWIDKRDIPGGPFSWISIQYTLASGTVGNVGFTVATFVADTLLIFRLFVVYGNNYYLIILPFLSNIAAATLSGIAAVQSVHPDSSGFKLGERNTMIPFFVLTITLNILLSLAITYRLLSVRRLVTTVVGAEHAKLYTSLSAVIIESAALTSVTGIIALACYIQNGVLQHFVLEVYDQIICLAPQLIVLRVALGRSYEGESHGELSTLKFRRGAMNRQTVTAQSEVTTVLQLGGSESTTITAKSTEDLEVKIDNDICV